MAVSCSSSATDDGVSLDLDQAIQACDFAIAVVEYPAGIVRLANPHMADLWGIPVEKLVGRRVADLIQPRHFVETTQTAFGTMAVDSVQGDRRIRRADGSSIPVRFWSRAIRVNGLQMAISLVLPLAEIGRIGRDPAAPWRDLAPVAVGTMDDHWRIDVVSSDVFDITGMDPAEYAGTSLLSLLHPDDAGRLTAATWKPGTTVATCGRLRLRNVDGTWTPICLLIGPVASEGGRARSAFALIAAPEPDPAWLEARVSELERRLRHIGAEVRASGVLDVMDSLPALGDSGRLSELTSRQWEILSRLARGDRVVTIASDLFLSQSTVRNHLAVIFRKFGVHSQSELLETLRRRDTER